MAIRVRFLRQWRFTVQSASQYPWERAPRPAVDRRAPTVVFVSWLTVLVMLGCRQTPVARFVTDPIAYGAHGALFGPNGREIVPTHDFLERAHVFYRDRLISGATPEQRSRYQTLRSRLVSGLDPRSRLVVDLLMLDWLVRMRRPPDAEGVLGVNDHLKRAARLREIPDNLRRRLEDAGLQTGSVSQPLVSTAGGQEYRDLCVENGVPIPPDWGTSQWIPRGPLSNEFVASSLDAEVFTFESPSPAGACIALPRFDGNRIEALGIICVGKASSKACFWDNQTGDPDNPQFYPVRDEVVPIDRFGGGNDLLDKVGGICTDCHAGENPFLIHPSTALGLPVLTDVTLFPDRWYEPIVKPGWPENRNPNLSPLSSPGACDGCHALGGSGGRLPALSSAMPSFCNILEQAMRNTMPPSTPGSLFNDPHAIALRAQCAEAPRPSGDLARFIRQTPPPATAAPNSPLNVSVTFANVGTTHWTGMHTVGVARPSGGGAPVWIANRSPLGTPILPVLPSEEPLRMFTLQAPAQPGTYDFAFDLRDDLGRVLAASPQVQVVVAMPMTQYNNAALAIVSAPDTLVNGQSGTVSIAATNTGTTTWTTAGYSLRLNRTMRVSLPQSSVAIATPGVPAGAPQTLSFAISCNGVGLGSFSVQVGGPTGAFGQVVGRTVVCQPQ